MNESEIVDNAIGAKAELGATLDATKSFWGAADGPAGGAATGSGSKLEGAVTFSPFKDAP